jgi:hypothetical protein
MTARKRLPNRRGSVSFGFTFENHHYRATAGYFDDGTLAELFLDTGKFGTPLQSNADTAAILASLLLQHGVQPEIIRHSVAGPVAVALAGFGKAERP